jgi:hypothetical protein
MPTLPSKAERIQKLASQLQYAIDNWDAHHREEDRTTIVAAALTMNKISRGDHRGGRRAINVTVMARAFVAYDHSPDATERSRATSL